MGTKKDVFIIKHFKYILQLHEQKLTNFSNSTIERMDKKISDLIGENNVLKNEVAELKISLQFHTDQWVENFKTLDNLKNELLQTKNINSNNNNQLYQT